MYFSILSRYLVKTYLEKFLLVLFVITISLVISNIFDLLNKTNGVSIGGSKFIQLALLKLPYLILEILPLNSMLAMFLMNYMLVNHNEMTIMWNSGISIFSVIMPIAITNFIIGILAIAVINPLSTHMLAKYDAIATKAIKHKPHYVILSNMGIIISEKFVDSKRIYVIKSLLVEEKAMNNVTILVTDLSNNFKERIDATRAILVDHKIHLKNVSIFDLMGDKEIRDEYILDTALKISNFIDSIAPPEHFNFWQLPEAINNLKMAGFSILRHQLYYYKTLFKPIYMMALIFLASCFITKDHRNKNKIILLACGIAVGFASYLVTQTVASILVYQSMNIMIAMLLPTMIIVLLSNLIILHLRID